MLLTPRGDHDSFKLFITDSIFFGEDGKAIVHLKTDKDGYISSSIQKLTIQDLRMRVPDIVKVKRQETRHIVSALIL